jgi:hypothetical protein
MERGSSLTPARRRPQVAPYGTSAVNPLVRAGANRPLGIVVLDFGQICQGPCATLLMAKAPRSNETE